MPYALNNDVNIYYEVEGKGPSLLLISPMGSDFPVWDNLMTLLVLYFRVIRYDYRGTRFSDKPEAPYRIEDFLQDTSAVLAATETDDVFIAGHGMGGFIAEYFAATYPTQVQGLVLISTLAKITETTREYLEQQKQLAQQKPEAVDVFKRQQMVGVPTQPPKSFIRQIDFCLQHDATSILSKIIAPTLIISGEEDHTVKPEDNFYLTAALANAKSEIIPGAGHMLQMEAPEEVVKSMINFLLSI